MFRIKSVDKIISNFTKQLADLEKAASWAEVKSKVHSEEVKLHQDLVRTWNVERLRAEQIAAKIKQIVS